MSFDNPVPIEVKKIHPDSQIPKKANNSDLGYDICVVPDDEWILKDGKLQYVLNPLCAKLFDTGLQIAIPETYGFLLWPRSGLAAKNKIDRMAGCIDSGYRGEWKVLLINLGHEPKIFYVGDKIVQAILVPNIPGKVIEVDELTNTVRGTGGFGSTGA